jgi:hypothetical protein
LVAEKKALEQLENRVIKPVEKAKLLSPGLDQTSKIDGNGNGNGNGIGKIDADKLKKVLGVIKNPKSSKKSKHEHGSELDMS